MMVHAMLASAPPATTLDVRYGEFLSTVDHLWDWRWQQRHVLALSELSGDLQRCGANGAPGPCCVAALGSSRRRPTLAPCADATPWTFSPHNGTITSGRLCMTLALPPTASAPPVGAAALPPPPLPTRFEVVMDECSINSTVWIQHQNAFQALGLPNSIDGLGGQLGHGPPAYCLQVNTAGPDWCDGIMCAKSSAKQLGAGSVLVGARCHNGDRRQYWQTKTVGTNGALSVNNYVPLSWSTAAYVGNGLVGVRVQDEGRTIAQGSRTLGGIGSLQIDIDNLMLGQGKRRQANGYWRLTLADNNSQSEYRVQMRTRLHHAIIEGNVTRQASEALVANFSIFVSANLSLPVVVLECDRYDGEACGLEFSMETKQDFTSFNTSTVVKAGVRRLTAFAALSAPVRAGSARSVVLVAEAVRVGRAQILQEHLAWWRDYWPQSFVSLGGPGATQVEQHYWTQMYRFPVSDRVALNGIIGDLGPTGFNSGNWNNDYYDDMNEELMYWISPASNRPSIATGIRKPGSPLWMLHNSWKQYDFEGNDVALQNIIFPALKSQVEKQVGTNDSMVGGANGTYHIGRCNSPEYGCFAPVVPGTTCSVANGHYRDCAYGLAQLRWGLRVLVKLNDKFALNDAAAGWWRALLDRQLVPFPTDAKTGYRLSVDCPFACPHRHFSHLLQIYNLEVVDPTTPLSLRSIDHYYNLTCNTSENWFTESCRGYSVCGIAGMNAVAGRQSAAQGNISFSLDTIIVPNGLYGENEMMNHPDEFGPTGEISYCLAGVLHTMLSHTTQEGVLQIFAGLDTWDAAFHNLRAAGGLLVSASRRNATTEFVRVQSVAARKVTVSVPNDRSWAVGAALKASPPSVSVVSSTGKDGVALWSVALAANESVVLHVSGGPPFTVRPLPANKREQNRYGYRRPFPPQK
eukprot:SAG31_NODE_1316_length_8838_cov_11.005031_1_plen_915_part_00